MKRNSRRVRFFLCIFSVLLLLCGCDGAEAGQSEQAGDLQKFTLSSELSQEDVQEERFQEILSETSTQEETADAQKPVPEDMLEETLTKILSADKQFLCGYPLDDSFLLWFRSAYGQAALESIAQASVDADAQAWYEQSGNSLHVLWLDYCEQIGLHEEQLSRVTRKECVSSERTLLTVVGDLNFDDYVGTMQSLKQDGVQRVFSADIRAMLTESDLLLINNECVFSTRGERTKNGGQAFRSCPSNSFVLQELGVDVAGIANEHTVDYGATGLADTIQTLQEAGIAVIGAGMTPEAAESPWYFVANGRKLAFVAVSQISDAADSSVDIFQMTDAARAAEVVRAAKGQSDYVIVFAHWGTVGSRQFDETQMTLAGQLAAAGADVILGSHSHCLQGISYVEDVPVFYSLGDFWFSSTPTDGMKKKDTMAAQVIVERDGSLRFRMIPCVQENGHVYMETETVEKARLITYINYLSEGIVIDANGYVSRKS